MATAVDSILKKTINVKQGSMKSPFSKSKYFSNDLKQLFVADQLVVSVNKYGDQ